MPKYKSNKMEIRREIISNLTVQGLSNQQIADQLGLSRSTVDKYVNQDEECRKMIDEKFANVQELGRQRLKEVYLAQIENLIHCADQEDDDTLKFRAAQYIIEKLDGKPAQQQKIEATVESNVTTINVNITDEE